MLLLGGLCWWTLGSLGDTGVDSVPEVISKACSVLAVVGGLCLITGLSDAWIRQRRWRTSLEQTEDERRNSR